GDALVVLVDDFRQNLLVGDFQENVVGHHGLTLFSHRFTRYNMRVERRSNVMPWVVGIDEAGYGPNLGPFVMASVACRLPAEHDETDLWHVLKEVVRRNKDRDDGRLLIEDSKVVYAPGKGLKRLERGVLASVSAAANLNGFLDECAGDSHAELREEC